MSHHDHEERFEFNGDDRSTADRALRRSFIEDLMIHDRCCFPPSPDFGKLQMTIDADIGDTWD